MMKDSFIAGSVTIDGLDRRANVFAILRASRNANLSTVMSPRFGFGGTLASLVFGKP